MTTVALVEKLIALLLILEKEKGLHAFSRACMRWAKSMRGPCLLQVFLLRSLLSLFFLLEQWAGTTKN